MRSRIGNVEWLFEGGRGRCWRGRLDSRVACRVLLSMVSVVSIESQTDSLPDFENFFKLVLCEKGSRFMRSVMGIV